MDTTETPEQRRRKALAKARVDWPKNRLLTQEEADRGLADLVEHGVVEFSIHDKAIRLIVIKEEKSPGKDSVACLVGVDGEALDELLICDLTNPETGCMFEVPKALHGEVGEDLVRGRTPYNVLFEVIGGRPFAGFFDELKAQRAEQAEQYDRLLQRVVDEAEPFRDVLMGKYRQLTRIDGAETWEMRKFQEEAKRFASKRLPDMPAATAVEIIVRVVARWVVEEGETDCDTSFDASMSPRDYER